MTDSAVTTRSPIEAMRSVPAPAPALDRERESKLTSRQRQILHDLGAVFGRGFIDLTMADLAAEVNCSLRTLYLLAESRNELVMIVIDRVLRDHGRAAHSAIDDNMTALEAIRAYLHAANNAVSEVTEEFASDMAAITEGVELNDAHSTYLIAVTRALLDLAVDRGEMQPVDTSALARMLGGLGRDFARPEVLIGLESSPAVAANAMVDLVLDGLERGGS